MAGTARCPQCGKLSSAAAPRCTHCDSPIPSPRLAGENLSIGDLSTGDRDEDPVDGPAADGAGRGPHSTPPKPQAQEPPSPPRPTVIDAPRRRKPTAGRPSRPAIKRLSYSALCSKFPGRPFLAMLGVSEPPPGYPLRHALVTLGRGLENRITVQDNHVSRAHALLAVVGRAFIVIDLDSHRGTFVNGRRVTQATLHFGDVIDLADTRAVFAMVPGADHAWGYDLCTLWSPSRQQAHPCPKQVHSSQVVMGDVADTEDVDDDAPDGRIVVEDAGAGRRVVSSGSPVLIGTHPDCRLHVEGDDVALFHAQVYWAEDGVRVRDLASQAGTFVNDAPVADMVLTRRDVIGVGKTKLKLKFFGDIEGTCAALAPKAGVARPLALTSFAGPRQGVSAVLPPSPGPLVLGRNATCDLYVDDVRVSAEHASLCAGADTVVVEDLDSRNGTYANESKVHKARAATFEVGDVLRVGRCEFLVHRAL